MRKKTSWFCLVFFLIAIFWVSISAEEERIAFRSHKDGKIYSYAVPDGITAKEYAERFNRLHPDEHAEPDAPRYLMDAPLDPLYSFVQNAYSLIHIPEAWTLDAYQEPNRPVIVAVLDSGCNVEHEDLQGRLLTGYNAIDKSSNVTDTHNHGTAVCGLIAAAANELGSVGAAGDFDVLLLPIKVVKPTGSISSSTVASAIDYAVAHGVDIINMSLGGEADAQIEREAVERALDAGIVVVCAAGNTTGSQYYYPASYDGCISVGSCNSLGVIARDSAHNDKVTLVAPGTYIASTSNAGSDQYGMSYAGTSFASPIVAGVCAMIRAVAPQTDSYQMKTLLAQTATDAGDEGRDDYYGYGYVNAYDALLSALCISRAGQIEVSDNSTYSITVPQIPEAGTVPPVLTVWEFADPQGNILQRHALTLPSLQTAPFTRSGPWEAQTVTLYCWLNMRPIFYGQIEVNR